MVLAVFVEFIKYREWTESLGKDREWFIQLTQSKVYQVIQSFASSYGGIALPLRYDYQIILLPYEINVREFNEGLRKVLLNYSPTPINTLVTCRKIKDLLKMDLSNENYREDVSCLPESLVVAHADLNDFTKKTRSLGIYRTYSEILNVIAHYVKELRDVAIVQYLGGDNIVSICDEENMQKVLEVLGSVNSIKVGVGISKIPRKAFMLAAEALDTIREKGKVSKYLVLYDQ
ncbi:MAG: GTP cyclohydrolase IIa [Desulfurococcaceae archaeon TW002]